MCQCTKFEREEEALKFLNKEAIIQLDTFDTYRLFILQDQVCGACTSSILSFVYSLDHQHSLIVVSGDNKELVKQLRKNIGESKVFVDKKRLVERYGLRYAQDLVLVFRKGELKYYAFLTEDNLAKIKKNLTNF